MHFSSSLLFYQLIFIMNININVQKLTDEQLTEDEDSAYILEVGFRKLFSWNDQGYGNTSRFGNLYFKFIITINNPLKIYET